MNKVKKITISALLTSMVIILTRFFSIQNIPFLPFVRISLGPALIIFASLYLGPIYGLCVGALSDILGIVLVPNSLGYAINPLITLVYGVLGVLPWIVYKLVKYIKNARIVGVFTIISAFLLFAFVTVFNFVKKDFTIGEKTHSFLLWQKFLVSGIALVLSIISVICLVITDKYFSKKYPDFKNESYKIGFVSIIAEFIVMLMLNTIVKTITFEIDFLFMFFIQGIVFFIDVPLNTFVVTYLKLLVDRMN